MERMFVVMKTVSQKMKPAINPFVSCFSICCKHWQNIYKSGLSFFSILIHTNTMPKTLKTRDCRNGIFRWVQWTRFFASEITFNQKCFLTTLRSCLLFDGLWQTSMLYKDIWNISDVLICRKAGFPLLLLSTGPQLVKLECSESFQQSWWIMDILVSQNGFED